MSKVRAAVRLTRPLLLNAEILDSQFKVQTGVGTVTILMLVLVLS